MLLHHRRCSPWAAQMCLRALIIAMRSRSSQVMLDVAGGTLHAVIDTVLGRLVEQGTLLDAAKTKAAKVLAGARHPEAPKIPGSSLRSSFHQTRKEEEMADKEHYNMLQPDKGAHCTLSPVHLRRTLATALRAQSGDLRDCRLCGMWWQVRRRWISSLHTSLSLMRPSSPSFASRVRLMLVRRHIHPSFIPSRPSSPRPLDFCRRLPPPPRHPPALIIHPHLPLGQPA